MFVLRFQAFIRGIKHENPLTRLETYKELTYIQGVPGVMTDRLRGDSMDNSEQKNVLQQHTL